MVVSKHRYDLGEARGPGYSSPGILGVIVISLVTSTFVFLGMMYFTGNWNLLKRHKKEAAVAEIEVETVPSVIGMPAESARDMLSNRKLRMIVGKRNRSGLSFT